MSLESLPLAGVPAVAEEPFLVLYREQFGALSAYCTSLVGNRETGAEIAQEAFTRLFARWWTVRNPRAFLFFVATNLATDHWRDSRRAESLLARLRAERRPDRVPGPDQPRSDVRDAVESLPRALRDVALLHYYADLPLAEIATLTRRPLGTVKRQLHQARALLQAALERP